MFKYTDTPDFDPATSHGRLAALIHDGDSVLEFGCAEGAFGAYIKEKHACTVYGVEQNEHAASAAKERLDRVITCDAESDVWEKELDGMTFDVILFADVLEHLYAPAALLARTKRFLKEDGRVLFSIPNIAHADILAKLYHNSFAYTDKGILDDTHIRHFAMQELPAFFEGAGFTLTKLDGTLLLFGKTEQGSSEGNDAVDQMLCAKENAYVYQYVGVAHHSEYAKKENLSLQNVLPDNASARYAELRFLDKDEQTISYATTDNPFAYVCQVPKDTRRVYVRFYGYAASIVDHFTAFRSGEACKPQELYGISLFDGLLFFSTNEASFRIDIAEDPCMFALSGILHSIYAEPEAISIVLTQNEKKRLALEALKAEKENLDRTVELARNDYADLSQRYDELYREHEATTNRMLAAENSLHIISTSESWRATSPIRHILDGIKKTALFRLTGKLFRYLKRHGLRSTIMRVRARRKEKRAAAKPLYTKNELIEQQSVVFEKDITFSVLVPLYNTPKQFLSEMIGSVLDQTYKKWELCLADGSDDMHPEVGEYCQSLAAKDARIKYQKLEKNLGISGNTNACIDMASGDYIALFDHDDLLHPAALFEMMKAICEQDADFVYTDENTFHDTPKDAYCPHFKPDYAPDTLRTNNYICHFNCFSRALLTRAGNYFRPECDGSQDYDMMLRLTEKAKKIVHIPRILYYWRAHKGSVATDVGAKPYVIEAAHRALRDHLERVGLEGEVLDTVVPSMYRIRYKLRAMPLVSIIIANKDHISDLDVCLKSIEEKSTYPNYEIVIVENNSTNPQTFRYYDSLKQNPRIKVVTWSDGKGTFNYSAINNYGVRKSSGEYVILLNNDIEIISPMWIEEMLMFAQREDVGAVGAKLYYPDDTIQHAGIGIGILTLAGHYHKNFPRRHPGYMGRLIYAHNVSAVTAACIMVPRRVWDEVEGLDEGYAVAFNDVDLCMKIREKDYLIVFTPFAEAYHYESKSRGIEDTPEKRARFESEVNRFHTKWRAVMDKGDPYYNPNFSLDSEDFSIR